MYLLPFLFGLSAKRISKIEAWMMNPNIITVAFVVIFLCLDWWTSGAGNMKNNMLKLTVSFSTIVILYNVCLRLEWNKYVDTYIRRCGIYSLAIYCAHWSFTHILCNPLSKFTSNELLAFVLTAIFAILNIETCILFKRMIAFSPVLDLLFFGNRKK